MADRFAAPDARAMTCRGAGRHIRQQIVVLLNAERGELK